MTGQRRPELLPFLRHPIKRVGQETIANTTFSSRRKSPENARDVRAQDFPDEASIDIQLKFVLNYAVLAPSIHNSQPWVFRVYDSDVEIYADRTRALAVVDPDDRSLIVSCGSAIETLLQCLRVFGFEYQISLFPDILDLDLLARVRIDGRGAPSDDANDVLAAIRRRHTIRRGFVDKKLDFSFEQTLGCEEEKSGARLVLIQDTVVEERLLEEIQRSDTANQSDKRFVRESASWMHPLRERSRDGIPLPLGESHNSGNTWKSHNSSSDENISKMALLQIESEGAQEWIGAGRKLMDCLISASTFGINAAIRDVSSTTPNLRDNINEITGRMGIPLLLLRFGKGKRPVITPRRPLVDVLLHPGYRK